MAKFKVRPAASMAQVFGALTATLVAQMNRNVAGSLLSQVGNASFTDAYTYDRFGRLGDHGGIVERLGNGRNRKSRHLGQGFDRGAGWMVCHKLLPCGNGERLAANKNDFKRHDHRFCGKFATL